MQNITTIISLASASVTCLITSITFITKFIKSAKQKKQALQSIRLTDRLAPLIQQAEQYTYYTGAEKKTFVLTQANQFAIENKIPFNLYIINSKIEELLLLTKQVNSKAKINSLPIEKLQTNSFQSPTQKFVLGEVYS